MRRLGLLVAGLALCAAGEAPLTRPSRDVVVTYAVEGPATQLVPGGLSGPVRLSWASGAQRVRAEAEGHNQVALLDLRANGGQVIDTGLRVSMPLRVKAADLILLSLEGARLVPKDGGAAEATVAGLRCREHRFTADGHEGAVCLTRDGVVLRGEAMVQGRQGRIRALSVQYGALPAERFEVPPGYIALPSLQGGGAGGGSGGQPAKMLKDLFGGLR